jgi:hypothetical protein
VHNLGGPLQMQGFRCRFVSPSILPLQARRLEGELEVKLLALTKLTSGLEGGYRSSSSSSSRHDHGSGLGPDQVGAWFISSAVPAPLFLRWESCCDVAGAESEPLVTQDCDDTRSFDCRFGIRSDLAQYACPGRVVTQLAQAKASEVEALLQRLSDVNDEMVGCSGAGATVGLGGAPLLLWLECIRCLHVPHAWLKGLTRC